jgi:hypothetical protein
MKLTDAQIASVGHKLLPKNPQCSNCGANNREVGQTLAALVVPEHGQLTDDRIVPLITVTCLECGHLRLFSASALGVLSDRPPAAAAPAE